MCTLVRYVSPANGLVRTELLELISLDATDCSAAKIYNAFKNCLTAKNIPLANIIGLASDGANVMVGKNNSFFSHLKCDVPFVILMQCLCHSSALIAGKACEKLPRGPEELIRNIATYCSGSAKRYAQLCELQDYFHVERKKILKLASTRWLSMQQCESRVLDCWDVLLYFFRIAVVEDKLLAAQNILAAMENNYNKLNVLVNNSLEDVNIADPNNYLPAKDMILGTECENYIKNFSAEATELVKNKCLEFYITAALEIKKRLPINNHLFQQLKSKGGITCSNRRIRNKF
ncbi:uncharacterized protein LOC107884008 [Acyrthosiphon pisum]|uniref:DUF4371 domain-containing protein n=1 Tax=Acyrthosiphon pisum TaxID=7029 RepID=A0A8R2D4B2_ACYPI|nr:uncharacterized protein LOC107884008 [Acyrthosiphon pisum]|eukprot:XP_016660748.1 PREDICTED: uncharacterized protein LOC107884008 [Acyrthosiphon pisum]